MLSDEALCERLCAGDLSAFEILYERYEPVLFPFIYRYLQNQQDSEEVFHEAFLSILKIRPDSRTHVRGWLYQVARNLCLNRLRGRKRESDALADFRGCALAEEGPDTRESEIREAASKLPHALAEVFELRARGLRYDEMANVMRVPLGTVRSRVHTMVKRLKKETIK